MTMKLSELHPTLTQAEREALAHKAGTTAAYLWQLANHWRGKRPSLNVIQALAAADERLTVAELVAEFARPANEQQREVVNG